MKRACRHRVAHNRSHRHTQRSRHWWDRPGCSKSGCPQGSPHRRNTQRTSRLERRSNARPPDSRTWCHRRCSHMRQACTCRAVRSHHSRHTRRRWRSRDRLTYRKSGCPQGSRHCRNIARTSRPGPGSKARQPGSRWSCCRRHRYTQQACRYQVASIACPTRKSVPPHGPGVW